MIRMVPDPSDYDYDFGGDTDVSDMPVRILEAVMEAAPAVIHDSAPLTDAVPVHIAREVTSPYYFPYSRLVLTV